MDKKQMIIIDGNSLIYRAFYGLPTLTTKDGKHTNAVYGFMSMLFKVLKKYDPEYVGVAFDLKAPTFRYKEYSEYKAGRKKMPPELAEQIKPLKDILDAMNIFRIESEGFEADDLIGTISKICEQNKIESLIVTADRDALQLASEYTKILITKKGVSNLEIYDDKQVMERYEVTPTQFIDLKGLMGDKSDNIPGVPGVGEKTAIKLLKQFGTVENLIQNTELISAKKLREKIESNIENIILSKRLTTIITSIPVVVNLDELKFVEPNYGELVELFRKHEFTSFIAKIPNRTVNEVENNSSNDEKKVKANVIIVDTNKKLEELISDISAKKVVVINSMTEEKNLLTDKIIAIALTADEEKQYYIDLNSSINKETTISVLKEILENVNIEKIGHNLKKEIIHFKRYGIEIKNIKFDTMIAEYLIDATKNSYDLDKVASNYIEEVITSDETLRGKGKKRLTSIEIPPSMLMNYLSQQVRATLKIKAVLENKIEELDMKELFYNVELPVVEVLASMEVEGIEVDVKMLEELKIEFSDMIMKLSEEIHKFADSNFNINSPKQLSEVLFNTLKLTPIKKTKTGYSTNIDVLEKLYKEHDIIPKIIEYRHVTKLYSTYVEGLLNIINPKSKRIHTSFKQTGTITGRLSSVEPNLQNIPVRYEMGRVLRKVFVASEGKQFIDADYSQIELRVLAHITKDENMIDSFEKGQDIHTRTASEIFGLPIDEVSSGDRSKAKAVNFGIVYGISDYGLSENLKITRKEAKKYIERYLDKYVNVKKYMENIVREAKTNGYVSTLLNRRRYLPEIKSSNFNIRSFAERTAMNTPIQGSAADIIKIAMVKVYSELRNKNLASKLILQVHDELIIEAPLEEKEEVSEIIRRCMKDAMELQVKLEVDLSVANNWYDAK
ncbi:MAG: DNA polymerase I [Clostridiales bacterium]|nr:DNA polymerase I [Clostridiales bacterium]